MYAFVNIYNADELSSLIVFDKSKVITAFWAFSYSIKLIAQFQNGLKKQDHINVSMQPKI